MAEVGALDHAIGDGTRPPDLAIAEIAERQHGVVAHRQLIAIGLGRNAIHGRLSTGRLHRLFTGVYAVGHRRLTVNGRWLAAVLACGPEALLSHTDAGALWGILPIPSGRTHVTAQRTRHRRAGILLHRPRAVHPEDRAVEEGIPVTSVARTLVDVAGDVRRRRLRRALEQADRLALIDGGALERAIDRGRGKRGVGLLRAVLHDFQPLPPITRSDLERRFLELSRRAGLPQPQVNVLVAGFEVDAFWPDAALVVELDGYAFHRTQADFERDRERDAALQVAGYRVIRITYRRLESRPAEVVELVRRLLSRRPERPRGAPGAGARARHSVPAG